MELEFDRGTLILKRPPRWLLPADLPDTRWDPRIQALRAPAWQHLVITEMLRSRGLQFVDRACHWRHSPVAAWQPLALRSYQSAALWAWQAAGGRGVVALPTGSGKTWVALGAMAALATPTLCVVPTRVLLHQWHRALTGVYHGGVGRWGDGIHELAPLTVTTFESAYRHMAKWGNRFEMLVVDEAHHFGRGTRDELLEMSLAPRRLGLTATPPVPPPGEDRLAKLVGPLVYRCTIGELSGRYLARFHRHTLLLDLTPEERRSWELEYNTFRRIFQPFRLARPDATWGDFLAEAGRSEAGQRAVAAWRVSRKLLGFTQAKAEALGWLLARHHEQKVLVFAGDNETVYRIAREHLIMPITCDIGRRERDRALERFREGQLRALVSARVLNEGFDVPDAEVGIMVAGTQGAREYIQRVGRLLRPAPGKRAKIYELVTRATPEMRQARERELHLDTVVRVAP